MLEFLSRFFSSGDAGTKDVAKERLQLVLIHDRGQIAPEVMENLKHDMLEVISKYLEVEKQNLEMNLDQQNDQVALVANIPVKKVRRDIKN